MTDAELDAIGAKVAADPGDPLALECMQLLTYVSELKRLGRDVLAVLPINDEAERRIERLLAAQRGTPRSALYELVAEARRLRGVVDGHD